MPAIMGKDGFNIAPAFLQLEVSDPLYMPLRKKGGGLYNEVFLQGRIGLTIKTQFRLWSRSFRESFDKIHEKQDMILETVQNQME